jgi:hypothetical protein
MCCFKRIALMLSALLIMLLSAICVLAASGGSIEVFIPVTNQGHAGTVGLFDKSGTKMLDTMKVDAEGSGVFKLTLDTLGKKSYIIRMLDEDTDALKYDASVFEADVYVEYDEKDKLNSVVTVKKTDETNKRSEGVVFRHIDDDSNSSSSVGDTETEPSSEEPTQPPETTASPGTEPGAEPQADEPKLPQTGTLRWLAPYLLGAGSILTLAGAICLRWGRHEE